jgi:O-acetyl-ADP-ribose deacetylase (regulator of RNase III)
MTSSSLSRIQLLKDDITCIKADAIVNAANQSLMGGGGVDGAIHKKGGPEILEECKAIVAKQGGCLTGEAVITGAGNLPAKYVIHTVGPIWRGGKENEKELLKKAYINSMRLGLVHHCHTLSFPNISTGVYHFPKKMAAEIAIKTVSKFLEKNEFPARVFFVCFDSENFDLYQDLLNRSH